MRNGKTRQEPAGGEEPLGDVLEFMRGLWDVVHALEARSKRMHRDLGVTGPQRLVVRFIGRAGAITPGELARALRLHPASVTRLVARLVARRLVVRDADPTDARRVVLRLTAAGARVDRTTAGTVESAVRRTLNASRPEAVRGASEVFARLAEELLESAARAAGPRGARGRRAG